jgi:hypothetical protein
MCGRNVSVAQIPVIPPRRSNDALATFAAQIPFTVGGTSVRSYQKASFW